jgi:hypothetical protein
MALTKRGEWCYVTDGDISELYKVLKSGRGGMKWAAEQLAQVDFTPELIVYRITTQKDDSWFTQFRDWVETRCNDKAAVLYQVTDPMIFVLFQSTDDAMMFRLVWGHC